MDERDCISGEVGFNLPDAAFALALSDEQRAHYRALENEDDLTIDGAHFVRGWAPIPIQGTDESWGLGVWIKISPHDFAEFTRLRPGPHPTYVGVIANQSLYGAPILGIAAEMKFREPVDGAEQRPEIRVLGDHPLVRFQANGVPRDTVRAWLVDLDRAGEPEPVGEPFDGDLARHGWMIHSAEAVGREPVRFETAPEPGDTVKVAFGVLVSDEAGEPMLMNAGWWVTLDDLQQPDHWSGTLSNYTRVPATITLGSRVWLRPTQVIQHAPAED